MQRLGAIAAAAVFAAGPTAEAEVVVRIPADAEAKPLDPKTDGWRVMKLVCATSDAERSRYGRFVGEADFDALVAKWRPPARKR